MNIAARKEMMNAQLHELWNTLWPATPGVLQLASLGITLPLVLCDWFLGRKALHLSDAMEASYRGLQGGGSYLDFFESLAPFLNAYLLSAFGLTLLSAWTVLRLLWLISPIKVLPTIGLQIRVALRLVGASMSILLLATLLGPLSFVSILILVSGFMLPAVAAFEAGGFFRTLGRTLSLGYAPHLSNKIRVLGQAIISLCFLYTIHFLWTELMGFIPVRSAGAALAVVGLKDLATAPIVVFAVQAMQRLYIETRIIGAIGESP